MIKHSEKDEKSRCFYIRGGYRIEVRGVRDLFQNKKNPDLGTKRVKRREKILR